MDESLVVIKRLEHAEEAQRAYCCMTEVPTPWPQALCLCRDWMVQNLGRHVEGYHLHLEGGEIVGHLYYALSERALVPYDLEPNVGVLYCEWIQRRYQKHGYSRRLFETFVRDMERAGVKGILVEGTDFEGQMHARHYLGRGFEVVHESGHRKLLYRPITQPRIRVRPLEPRVRPRRGIPVEILVLSGYLCPYEVSTLVLLREVAQEFGDRVTVRQLQLTPETLQEYGVAKGVFINGRQKLGGAETEDAIRQAILEELERV